jgi:hypothetical protein
MPAAARGSLDRIAMRQRNLSQISVGDSIDAKPRLQMIVDAAGPLRLLFSFEVPTLSLVLMGYAS